MTEGYIKLHRKILENPYCKKPHYGWLWVYLLLKANHKDTDLLWDGGLIKLKAGQFVTGRNTIAEETGIKPTTIERILKMLENGHQIGQQKNNKFRIITIENWKKYQDIGQQTDIKSDNKRTSNGQQTDTDKNDNNDKNDKNNTMQPVVADPINELITLFEPINPSYKQLYSNKTQRSCLERLLKIMGREKLEGAIKTLYRTNKMDYAPQIFTPYELEKKMGALIAFVQKEGNKVNSNKIATL